MLFAGYDWASQRLADTKAMQGSPGGTVTGSLVFDDSHERLTLFDGNGTWVYLP